jgi:FixJ family two-component response regulator
VSESNVTIFVVDDDESVLKALKRLIKTAGFNVEAFSSAHEFLKCDYSKRPGLLVLDVRMPEMSGIELQKRLVESGSKMPIIFITAHGNGETCRLVTESGAVAFLQKPFEDQALLDAVCTGLERRPAEGLNQKGACD